MTPVSVRDITISNDAPFALISGPCQLETLDHARMLAAEIAEAAHAAGTRFIFKASFDKANRSSLAGKRGVGIDEGLTILSKIRDEFGCPVITDIHDVSQCAPAAKAVDALQIPAFLCRQTDLLLAARRNRCRDQRQKGSVPCPLGHDPCGAEDRIHRQQPHHAVRTWGKLRL